MNIVEQVPLKLTRPQIGNLMTAYLEYVEGQVRNDPIWIALTDAFECETEQQAA